MRRALFSATRYGHVFDADAAFVRSAGDGRAGDTQKYQLYELAAGREIARRFSALVSPSNRSNIFGGQ